MTNQDICVCFILSAISGLINVYEIYKLVKRVRALEGILNAKH